MTTVQLAKFLMRRWETRPPEPTEVVGELSEVFRHPVFLEADEEERRAIMLRSSEAKYRSEMAYPWDHYFGVELAPLLRGKTILDHGCFTGGRGVAWHERYGLRFVHGIDVKQVFIDAARQFAARRGVPSEYHVAHAEELPFADDALDAVLSFDVFEHVRDVRHTLEEIHRVLRPGGRLFVVFPGYWHPVEHHLGLVSGMPGLHYLFGGRTLVRAYKELLDERGQAARWYARESAEREPWERGHTINGTTAAGFRRLLGERDWRVVLRSRKPIGSIGRRAPHILPLRAMSAGFAVLAAVPGLEEIALHRITYILEKREA